MKYLCLDCDTKFNLWYSKQCPVCESVDFVEIEPEDADDGHFEGGFNPKRNFCGDDREE